MDWRFVFRLPLLGAAAAALLLPGCSGSQREVPGDVPNPLLATMLSEALARDIARLGASGNGSAMLPDAPAHARQWLVEIAEVVSRCRHGPRNQTKFNLLEYDITLRSGERIENVHSGRHCEPWSKLRPLIMRVRFDQGRVLEVLTDGREKDFPPSFAISDANAFSSAVLRVDQTRRTTLYLAQPPSAADNAKQWDSR